jgi:hypothetical protein
VGGQWSSAYSAFCSVKIKVYQLLAWGEDPCVKLIYFHPLYDSPSSSVNTSPKKPDESPKRKCLEESPGAVKKPKFLDEQGSTNSVSKFFVPDVLVERIVDSLDCATELFNISVKSGHTITERDHSQLKYELLPVLLKQEVALGMIICAGEAYLEKICS